MADDARTDPDLQPEEPHDAGVSEADPDVSHIEGARVLADQAEDRLRALGFTDDEIRHWAEAYCREEGSGDVDSLVAWIAEQEHRA
jgi:hypothetical protein